MNESLLGVSPTSAKINAQRSQEELAVAWWAKGTVLEYRKRDHFRVEDLAVELFYPRIIPSSHTFVGLRMSSSL